MHKEKEKAKKELDISNIVDGYDFENYISNLLVRLGNSIDKVTKKSGDQGADIIAHINDKKYVIQVKFYSSPVGNKAVQEVVASMGMYKADKAMVITNSTYTKSAIQLARANDVKLIDGNQLNVMVKKIENDINNT